jgi:hypothetical protein
LNRFLQVTSEDDRQATMADIIMGDDVSPSAVGVSGSAPLAVVASVPVVVSGPADWEINGVFLGHSGEEIKSVGPSSITTDNISCSCNQVESCPAIQGGCRNGNHRWMSGFVTSLNPKEIQQCTKTKTC